MGAFLIDRPPLRRGGQFTIRTYWKQSKPTGLTVIHTAENIMDEVGPDTGAENVADFIRRRSDPGSYHDLVDSDTAVWMVPYEMGAYQDGTGSNGYALSISFALKAADWPRMSREEQDGFLRQGAVAFRRQQAWLRSKGYPTTPLRRITRAQSEAGEAGFISHAERDPERRSDPGAGFPWDRFFAFCANPTQEEDLANISDTDAKALLQRVEWLYNSLTPAGGPLKKNVSIGFMTLQQAAADARAARLLAESAAKGLTLTDEDVDRIAQAAADEVAEDLAKGYDLQVMPKVNNEETQ